MLLSSVNCSLLAQSYYSNSEADKGYWQVYTDYKTGNTVIQFFNSKQQLTYKETLSKKYVKLTKRNVRRFDQLLSRLTDSNLLGSTVKSYDLVADSRTTFRKVFEPKPEEITSSSYHQTSETNVYIVKQGRLRIILKNPFKEHFDVRIIDDQLRTIHYEDIDETGYNRWFDISKLVQGIYKIRINSPRVKLYYNLGVDDYLGYTLEHVK